MLQVGKNPATSNFTEFSLPQMRDTKVSRSKFHGFQKCSDWDIQRENNNEQSTVGFAGNGHSQRPDRKAHKLAQSFVFR
jgi:hypothetical protein